MRVAFLFPGQGMHEPVVPEVLKGSLDERRVVERVLGSELSRAVFEGRGGLERTDVLQPVLVAASLAVAARLSAAGVEAQYVAGHSVGEIAALAAAGAATAEEAIHVAAVRGRLMAREAARRPGGMLALLDSGQSAAADAIAVGARHGVVGLAAVNAPDQWVLSGELPALDAVAARFPSRRLPVAGAWHSELMAGARLELLRELKTLGSRELTATLIANRTGQPMGDDDDLPEVLAGQLVRPVQWMATMAALERLEVTDLVMVGPGRILRGLVRKNLGNKIPVHTTDDDADIDRTIERLKGTVR